MPVPRFVRLLGPAAGLHVTALLAIEAFGISLFWAVVSTRVRSCTGWSSSEFFILACHELADVARVKRPSGPRVDAVDGRFMR